MKTRVTELLQIEYPIIQGGMAWVAEHHLAAAVSGAVLFFDGGAGTFYGNCEAGRERSVDERIM